MRLTGEYCLSFSGAGVSGIGHASRASGSSCRDTDL
jgi:hypothetical protein